ncbi:hypothetical protein cypCar_00029340 [Cyprinus carpio]|nr:hypothetical protein cypCar_00029340 [Cyprinus carpio]
MPSTSNGESSKQEPSSSSSSSTPRTCKNSEIEKITEDSTATTLEALKARIRELEKQILRGDRYKCLICMRKPTQTGADGKNQVVERHGSAEALQLGVYCLYRGYVTGCSTATAASSGIKKLLPLRRDSYTMPLTSIQCWHVHCEECWLRTLSKHYTSGYTDSLFKSLGSVGCRGPALTDRGPAVRGGELLMGLSMQPLSQARLEASGRSAGGSRSALRPHPQTCGAVAVNICDRELYHNLQQ